MTGVKSNSVDDLGGHSSLNSCFTVCLEHFALIFLILSQHYDWATLHWHMCYASVLSYNK